MVALLLLAAAWAGPHRAPPPKPAALRWEAGRQRDVLVVKLAEDQGLVVQGGRVTAGPGDLDALNALLAGAQPHLRTPAQALAHWQAQVDPQGALADLRLYLRLRTPDAAARGAALLRDPRVEAVYFAFEPAPPPADIGARTPDLTDEQGYTLPGPDGVGTDAGPLWPGGTGGGVRIADLEYGWNPDHEDLDLGSAFAWGEGPMRYPCHGTMVLGMLGAPDNGYGVTGMVPDAELLVVSPYVTTEEYSLPDAVVGAAGLLVPGNVLLIEQQIIANGDYAPVEADPATWDAIALAVAGGISVVEPAGNGAQDLDASAWSGWFDRDLRDNGAILVGGGAPPAGDPPRAWMGVSNYGSRVDLQGWQAAVATTSHSRTVDPYCPSPDLFFPDNDGDQAYTSEFGGTSAASPMVTAVVAAAQGVALQTRGAPWDPMDLRAALVATGAAQQGDVPIGPQPDLRVFLRTWGVK